MSDKRKDNTPPSIRVTVQTPNDQAVEHFTALITDPEITISHLSPIFEHLLWLALWLRAPRFDSPRTVFRACLEIIATDKRMRSEGNAEAFVDSHERGCAYEHYQCLLAAVNLALAREPALPPRPTSPFAYGEMMMIQHMQAAQAEMPKFKKRLETWDKLVARWAKGGTE